MFDTAMLSCLLLCTTAGAASTRSAVREKQEKTHECRTSLVEHRPGRRLRRARAAACGWRPRLLVSEQGLRPALGLGTADRRGDCMQGARRAGPPLTSQGRLSAPRRRRFSNRRGSSANCSLRRPASRGARRGQPVSRVVRADQRHQAFSRRLPADENSRQRTRRTGDRGGGTQRSGRGAGPIAARTSPRRTWTICTCFRLVES